MFFKTFSIFFLTLLSITFVYPQKIVVSGYMVDSSSGESLINGNINDSVSLAGAVTNKFGYYSIQLKQNALNTLKFSFVGYKTVSITFTAYCDTTINVKLNPGTVLAEVEVLATSGQRIEEKAEISKINIPLQNIKRLPSISGEPDILKAYQLMPGIQSGTEGNNGLYVRGGTPDQNLFLLDDVVLYNVSHLGGMFSVFDPSMVKSVDLYKGGFPARYGGRLSSVVDVRNKDGNIYSYKGEIGFSTFISKLFVEGPIKKENSSFAFSVRKSNLDAYSFIYNKLKSNQFNDGYTFYDINLKANFRLSHTNRIFFSVFHGRDKFFFKEKDINVPLTEIKYSASSEIKWGNSTASIRWLHVFKNNVFNNLTFAFTKYQYKNSNSYSRTSLIDKSVQAEDYLLYSDIKDFLMKSDIEIPINQNKIRLGGIYSKHFFVPNYISYSQKKSIGGADSTLIKPSRMHTLNSDDFFGYAEFQFNLTSKISGNAGIRAGYYIFETTKYVSIEPRIILNYLFLPTFSLKASYCYMEQNNHLLSNSNTGLPSDLWIPSTSTLKPESSEQFTLGVSHTSNRDYEFIAESFYKTVNNLIEYKEGVLIYNSALNLDNKIEMGGFGKIKGIELLIIKKKGAVSGWAGYSLSKNTRNFRNINNGKDFPFVYDQRHNISIVCNYNLNRKISLSATWVFHTGNSLTLPSEKYELFNTDYEAIDGKKEVLNDVHIYSSKNGYRMPNYHRLDFGLNYTKIKRKGISTWQFSIYNVYNRQNAYYIYFKITPDGKNKLYQKSLFPFLLNFGYTYSL